MTETQLESMEWFQELKQLVQEFYDGMRRDDHDQRPDLEVEKQQLQSQVDGWSLSLAKADLDHSVRDNLEGSMQTAIQQIADIEHAISQTTSDAELLETIVDSKSITTRLGRLDEILASNNCSLGNIELAQHIDTIKCFPGGRVILRTCRLGALSEAVELFKTDYEVCQKDDDGKGNGSSNPVKPRRRTRRRIDYGDAPSEELKSLAAWATDPDRFAGLDEQFFEEIEFQVPVKLSWAEENAAEVARLRIDGMTVDQVAKRLGKSIPTIRSALKYAATMEEFVGRLPTKQPRRRWHEDQVAEVVDLKSQGWSVPQMAKYLGKSEPTIRKAVQHAIDIGLLAEDTDNP
jgi:transposase